MVFKLYNNNDRKPNLCLCTSMTIIAEQPTYPFNFINKYQYLLYCTEIEWFDTQVCIKTDLSLMIYHRRNIKNIFEP